MDGTFGRGPAVGVGVVVALLILNGALAFRNTYQLDEDARWVAHTHEVLDTLAGLKATLQQAQAAERVFLVTNDRRRLEPLDAAARTADEQIDGLQRLTEDNARQQGRMAALRAAVAGRLERMKEVVRARQQEGPDTARQLIESDDEEKTSQELRRVVGEMGREERDLLREREAATARAYLSAVITGLLTALLGLAAVVTFALLLRRYLRARLRAAAVIRRERERFRITLASIGDAVIVTDARGRVTFLNAVAEALTGWTEGAPGRELPEVFRIVNEQTGEAAENPVSKVLREGVVVGLANHTVLAARDGTVRPIEDSAAPIKDETGQTLGVVLVFHDVTEQRASEKTLRRLYAELQEADRKKDEFLAMLAHELRNPLAPLRNAVCILRLRGTDAATAERAKDIMERQIRHMVRLVDDLLDVSRIMQGKIELRKEPVEVATVVARAVENAQPAIDAQGHQLTVSLRPEPVWVDADPVRLAQVIGNLLTNSAKYMDGGGRIRLDAARQGEELVLRVRDSGIGIAPEFLPRMFDLFVQAEHGVGRAQGGLGIGLTLVRRLVEMHGGSVTAHSEGIGKGSEFVVRLPLHQLQIADCRLQNEKAGESAAASSNLQSAICNLQSRKILVVDDNVDAADSLAVLLRHQGQDVRVAHDGPSALDAARTDPPEMVFLDIGLPGMDGYEVARRLRANPALAGAKLVALTGYGQEEDRRRSQEAGFDLHLVKPADPAAVEHLLQA